MKKQVDPKKDKLSKVKEEIKNESTELNEQELEKATGGLAQNKRSA